MKSSAQGSGAAMAEAETETPAQEADVMPALDHHGENKAPKRSPVIFHCHRIQSELAGAENLRQDSVISCFYFELFSILFLWI